MPLVKQTTVLPVASGVDTGSDPKLGPAGKLVAVDNGYYNRTGELKKRDGSVNLSASTIGGGSLSATTPYALATLDGQLVYLSRSGNVRPAAIYSDTAAAWVSDDGSAYGATVDGLRARIRGTVKVETLREFNGTFSGTTSADPPLGLAAGGGYRMFARAGRVMFTDSDGVLVADHVTATFAAASHQVACLYTGTYFVLVVNAAAAECEAFVWSASNVSGTPANYPIDAAGFTATQPFDVQVYSATQIRVCRVSNAGTGMQLYQLNCSTGAVTSAIVSAAFAIVEPTSVTWVRNTAGSGSHLCYTDATNGMRVSTINAALAATATYVVEATLTSGVYNTVAYALNASNQWGAAYSTSATGGAVGFVSTFVAPITWFAAETHIASYPAASGTGDFFILIRRASAVDPTLYLVRLPDDACSAPTARINAYEVDGATSSNYRTELVPTATGELLFNWPLASLAGTTDSVAAYRVTRITFDPTVQAPVELGGSLYGPGGQLTQFDGRYYAEHGFPHEPPTPTIAQVAGGNLTVTGTYQWCTVYRYVDESGRTHLSAPSVPTASITLAAGNRIATVTCGTLHVTSRSSPSSTSRAGQVYIDIYRTQSAGTTFNYVGTVENDASVSTVAFTDGDQTAESDANILDNQLLYTTGGYLEAMPAPPCHAIAAYRGRLFVVDSENPTDIWYSKELEDGLGPQFSDALVVRTQRPILALVSCDDRLLLFARDAIYYIAGDGPDTLGRGVYAPPGLITATDGVISTAPGTVTATPDGVLFQSERGFKLVDRSLAVQDIGKALQGYDGNEYTTGVYLPRLQQTHVFSTDGVTAVFDHHHKLWTTSSNQAAQCAAVLFDGEIAYANAAGVVSVVTQGTFADNGAAVRLSVTTGWISTAGLEGFARIYQVRLLGSWNGTYSVTVAYDYDETVVQTLALIPANISTMALRMSRQKCTAFKLVITESGAASAGFTLTAIALECGVKPGLYGRPSANRMV